MIPLITDAGHGGPYLPMNPRNCNLGTHDEKAMAQEDGSKIWVPDYDGLVERDIVLDIEDRVHSSLGEAPMNVGRCHSLDVEMSQAERGRASMRHGALFMMSLHVNANADPKSRGAQLYVRKGDKIPLRLAHDFVRRMQGVFNRCKIIEAWNNPARADDDWMDHPLAIINAHACDVVLFELGFRTNKFDREILMSELGRSAIAFALCGCLARAAQEYGSV